MNGLQGYQSGQSLIKANRRRCYCSSEPPSLQRSEEGQFPFFFFGEYDFVGKMPEQTTMIHSVTSRISITKPFTVLLFLIFTDFLTAFSTYAQVAIT